MAVQTRNITVNIFDNDGAPLENARVIIILVGLGNEPGGAVAPGVQEKFTNVNGQVIFELWENNGIYSKTHYEVQSWHPLTHTTIHRRNKFHVPDHDAALEDLIVLETAAPNPGQQLGNLALLNASTVGRNLVQMANPNAVRFIRINADNSVSALDDEEFREALGGVGSGGVSSIAITVPTGLNVSGSPLTSAGSIAITFATGYSIPSNSKQGEWDTAFADRNKWDGGNTGLNPGMGRSSLGATTVGSSFFTTANPSAITYPRVNANNSITYVSASTLAGELGVTNKLDSSAVGVSVASLVGGVVPSIQLPSYVDDVLEFANLAAFPTTGETGKIYIAVDTNRQYRWSGSAYVQIVASPGTTDNVPEGATNVYHTQTRVRSTTLAGFVAAVGLTAISATDSILVALQKIQGWLNGLGNLSTVNASADVLALVGAANNAAIRTSIGATTVGNNLFTSTNPGEVSFLRVNADNTVTYLDAASFRGAIGASVLSNFVESKSTAAPNASTPVVSLAASGSETNIDFVILPKGNGAIVAAIPDGAATGGGKRGTMAVDLQLNRNSSNKIASGAFSFIGGGSNNTASGNYSVAFGSGNTASGDYSVAAGDGNTAAGNSNVALGWGNNVNSIAGAVAIGRSNVLTSYSIALGSYATDRGVPARALSIGGFSTVVGNHQERAIFFRSTTSDATPKALTTGDFASPSASSTIILPDNSSFVVTGKIVARKVGSLECKSWQISLMIKRGSGAGSVQIEGTPVATEIASAAGASSWTIAISANTTLGGLSIVVTGQAATSIRWGGNIESYEITDD